MGAGPPGGSRARVSLLALALANADAQIQAAAAEEQTTFSPEIAAIAATWPTWSHLATQSQTATPAVTTVAAAARSAQIPAFTAAVSSTALPADAAAVSSTASPGVAAAVHVEQQSFPSKAPEEVGGDAQASKLPPLGALPQKINGFELVGSRGTSLRGINGGRRCVDPWGFEPPGWQINATSLDLDTCSLMASLQPNVVGFRWGRIGFNQTAYMHYARPRAVDMAAVDSAPVNLDELFSGGGKFKCNIYVVSHDGKAPPLKLDNATAALGKHARRLRSEEVEPARKLAPSFRFFRGIDAGRTIRVGAYGRGVCMQRRSLLRYYDLKTTEMWFCFSHEVRGLHCAEEIQAHHTSGAFSLIGTLVFVTILGCIAQSQWQLSWALSWVASFFVNLELAVASIALLLQTRMDLIMSTVAFEALALALVVVGTQFVFLPYVCCNVTDTYPAMRMSYLLALVILPCVSLDLMSYWSAFPLLVNHWPVMLGLVGFVIDALRRCIFGRASETSAPCAWPKSLLYTDLSPHKHQYQSMVMSQEGLLKL